ncbi:MAG: hypothetical protein RR139_09970 [Lachnospiraceae bacterium]
MPLFLFLMFYVLFFFRALQIQYIVADSLGQAASKTSLMGQETPEKVELATKGLFYQTLLKQDCPLTYISLGLAGFSWKESIVDEEYLEVKVNYRIKNPITFFGNTRMHFSEKVRIRRWTGDMTGQEGKENQHWVYITPTGSVYHKSRSCTHLKLSIEAVTPNEKKKILADYEPCGFCAKAHYSSGTLYITKEGRCYHTKLSCPGLKRTIYMIPFNQVGGRKPCSRCGGD